MPYERKRNESTQFCSLEKPKTLILKCPLPEMSVTKCEGGYHAIVFHLILFPEYVVNFSLLINMCNCTKKSIFKASSYVFDADLYHLQMKPFFKVGVVWK